MDERIVTKTQLAKTWGVSGAYVSKLIKKGIVRELTDGRVDLDAADTARERGTLVGRGQRKYQRAIARQSGRPRDQRTPVDRSPVAPFCLGCGDRYILQFSRNSDTPQPDKYCSAACEQDAKDGLTRAKILARRERGTISRHIVFVKHPRPVPAPRPTPIIAICLGCGGRYDVNYAREQGTRDPERYCDQSCQHSIEAGLSREEIRRFLRTNAAEDGTPAKKLRSEKFFDYL